MAQCNNKVLQSKVLFFKEHIFCHEVQYPYQRCQIKVYPQETPLLFYEHSYGMRSKISYVITFKYYFVNKIRAQRSLGSE